jgi:hypothetical protein
VQQALIHADAGNAMAGRKRRLRTGAMRLYRQQAEQQRKKQPKSTPLYRIFFQEKMT